MTKLHHTSLQDAFAATPEPAENMRLRSALMMALKQRIAQSKLTQAQAAELLGVTQPRISDLVRGKAGMFGLDALVNMAAAAGLHVEMRVLEAA